MPLYAVQHIKRMRGGAQAHLMRADDEHFYVVKFRNNPQHLRVLANEMFATRLAERAGLPVPQTEVIEVSPWLVEKTPDLRIELAGQSLHCCGGVQFGARYVVDPLEGQALDYLPDAQLEQVKNLNAFAGMLAFDKWTGNVNGRQAVFHRKGREKKYTATFIDQGYCFNAGEWTFADAPLRGVYARNIVYKDVRGWESFEPWLGKIESLTESEIGRIAADVPLDWYGDYEDMERLVAQLVKRRERVKELIWDFKQSSRNPFPNWTQVTQ